MLIPANEKDDTPRIGSGQQESIWPEICRTCHTVIPPGEAWTDVHFRDSKYCDPCIQKSHQAYLRDEGLL